MGTTVTISFEGGETLPDSGVGSGGSGGGTLHNVTESTSSLSPKSWLKVAATLLNADAALEPTDGECRIVSVFVGYV